MGLFKKNKKKELDRDSNRKIFLQWAIPIMLMLAVLVVVVSNAFMISKSDAKHVIYERLTMQSKSAAKDFKSLVDGATAAAMAVGRVMEDPQLTDEAQHIAWCATELKKAQPSCYMIVIADNEGQGYTSEGAWIDISKKEYFSISRFSQAYKIKNDGITGSEAYVFAVPYYKDNISVGNIYMFIEPKAIEEVLPTYDYDTEASFGICDSRGIFIGSFAEQTEFFGNNQFIENLRGSNLLDTTFARITTRLGKRVEFVFSAEYKGEQKTIVGVPLGIDDWQYVTVLNQKYVDTLVEKGWVNVRSLAFSLGVLASAYLVLMMIISLINRVKLNRRNRELAAKADTDLLTELNNKIATERKIQEYIDTHPDSQGLFFLFDIDNFKKINDTMGHAFGDEVLRTLGVQLRNEFRVTDIIGRTGGDEFILFLKDLKTDEIIEKEAKRLEQIFDRFEVGEYVKYAATSSIGATIYPRDAKDYEGLYKTADKALYEAKRRGKNCLVFYNKELQELNVEKENTPIESDVR